MSSGSLLKKVYFPRLILPVVGVVTGLVELAIQFGVLALLMIWYQYPPGWQILLSAVCSCWLPRPPPWRSDSG